ncbi:hypothetical protein [Streptomyces sp. LaPpAH-108]|uniref:hypothetical protein n=1 Tax=Streptomyces sp. LaPpAH-108 TaxID=1155714 RepID=UPI0004773C06
MPARASSVRRASVTALGVGRAVLMGMCAALILFAGAWGSWGTAQHVMLPKGREHGTMRVTECSGDRCTGPFTPTSEGAVRRARVVLAKSVAVREGRSYEVTVEPGTDVVVRSGLSGTLFAWLPLGGALVLASVVVAGGMRLTRTGWVLAGLGVALLTGAFVTAQ